MAHANLHGSEGKLRIIAGYLRGSRLSVPNWPDLRPTSDRIRETVFNWLTPIIAQARCLDLFAGTGALGIEALSRGASEVVFVERERALAQLLKDNLARLKAVGGEVYTADATAYLGNPSTAFDIVFLDPPFKLNLWAQIAQRLEMDGWLATQAWVYVEAPIEQALVLPENWLLHREGKAGAVRYILYRRNMSAG